MVTALHGTSEEGLTEDLEDAADHTLTWSQPYTEHPRRGSPKTSKTRPITRLHGHSLTRNIRGGAHRRPRRRGRSHAYMVTALRGTSEEGLTEDLEDAADHTLTWSQPYVEHPRRGSPKTSKTRPITRLHGHSLTWNIRGGAHRRPRRRGRS